VDWIGRWARERPGENAVVDTRAGGTRLWTWEELDQEADKAAALLLELGVEPGETVAYQLPNWGEFVILTLACMKIGAICCALMPIFREREIGFALRRSKARVLVVAEEFRGSQARRGGGGDAGGERFRGKPRRVEQRRRRWRRLAACRRARDRGRRERRSRPPEKRGRALGTTSPPRSPGQEPDTAAINRRKPAPTALSQLFFTSGIDRRAERRPPSLRRPHPGGDDGGRAPRPRPRRHIFIPTPLAHQTGLLYGMWLSFALGSTQVIQDVWDRAAAPPRCASGTAPSCRRRRRSSPTWCGWSRLGDEPTPPALRIFVVTGAAVPRALAEAGDHRPLRRRLRRLGLDRVLPRRARRPGDDPAKVWGSDGRALAGTRIRIVDDADNRARPGRGGATSRSQPLPLRGLPRPSRPDRGGDDRRRLVPTGDLATIDGDGYLRLTGRVKDIINRGGEKVPVAENRAAHARAPGGRRGGDRGDARRAAGRARLRLGRPRSRLRRGLRPRRGARVARLARDVEALWPERVETLAEMPRTPSGKIQKFVLREQAKGLRPESNLIPTETEEEPVR